MNTSEKTLEFSKIIEQLIPYASCSLGVEAINNIEITNDFALIQNLIDETEEALKSLTIPVLDYQSEETYIDEYDNFYEKILSNN